MKIYNYSSLSVKVEGVEIENQVSEIPDAFRGELTVGGTSIPWQDDPYQYLMITEDGGTVTMDYPVVPEPPYIYVCWLMVAVFTLTLFEKILQKVKIGG